MDACPTFPAPQIPADALGGGSVPHPKSGIASQVVEERLSDPQTGAQKGRKLARFALLPPGALWMIAEVFGFGAAKYADRNWEAGYPWSWSYDALQRHLNAFWDGEELDPESGLSHLAHAGFHILALLTYTRTNRAKDDRPKRG